MQYMYGVPQSKKRPGRFRRTIRNLFLSAVVLVVLLIAAGFIYVLIIDKGAPAPSVTSTVATQANPLLRPTQPNVNAPEGAAVQSIASPVSQGGEGIISVETNEGSSCTIKLSYVGAPDSASLNTQNTDIYGDVSWNWHITANAPIGTWPVTVTCVYHGRSAVVVGNMQITK